MKALVMALILVSSASFAAEKSLLYQFATNEECAAARLLTHEVPMTDGVSHVAFSSKPGHGCWVRIGGHLPQEVSSMALAIKAKIGESGLWPNSYHGE